MERREVSDLEAALGQELLPADRGSISKLNELPEQVIVLARKLESRQQVRQLIEYYCGLQSRPYLPDFIDKVILGSVASNLWRRGDVLVPAPSLAAQLTEERSVLLAPIGGYQEVRIIPEYVRWKEGISWIGAPAKVRPLADYQSDVPEGSVNLVAPQLEAAPNADITVRRWIAARIARSLPAGERREIKALFLAHASLPGMERWSNDARVAAKALFREFHELPQGEGEVPGFRGPDSWYL